MNPFWLDPVFYGLIVIGCVAFYPRVVFLLEREAAAPNEIKPSLPQRLALFIPAICVIFAVLTLQQMWVGLALVVIYSVAYAAMILFMRRARGL